MRIALPFSLALVVIGCGVVAPPTRMIPEWTRDWHRVVTDNDRKRLRDWRATFSAAIDAAKKSGHSADVAREGVLLDPDAALGGGPIPNGTYRCRVIKVGAKSQGMLDYVSYPPFTCSITAKRDLQQFAKLNGSQRQFGLIFPGDLLHQVFLGTLVLGDETRALQYGQDETRDVVGYVERIGPNRWRLVMPNPHFESQLDLIELVPVAS
jgi:hypothetical protein